MKSKLFLPYGSCVQKIKGHCLSHPCLAIGALSHALAPQNCLWDNGTTLARASAWRHLPKNRLAMMLTTRAHWQTLLLLLLKGQSWSWSWYLRERVQGVCCSSLYYGETGHVFENERERVKKKKILLRPLLKSEGVTHLHLLFSENSSKCFKKIPIDELYILTFIISHRTLVLTSKPLKKKVWS